MRVGWMEGGRKAEIRKNMVGGKARININRKKKTSVQVTCKGRDGGMVGEKTENRQQEGEREREEGSQEFGHKGGESGDVANGSRSGTVWL